MSYKLKTILAKIDYWEDALKNFQDNCKHTNVVMKYRANTGNYDPSADYSWREYACGDCDKRWTKDGHRD